MGPDAVEPLIALLKSAEGEQRTEIVAALGQIGPGARGAMPALLAILGDEATDESVRRAVVAALQQLGPLPIDELVRAAKGPDRGVRMAAVEASSSCKPSRRRTWWPRWLREQLRSPRGRAVVGPPPSSFARLKEPPRDAIATLKGDPRRRGRGPPGPRPRRACGVGKLSGPGHGRVIGFLVSAARRSRAPFGRHRRPGRARRRP